jgi:hypothetical protein
VENSINQFVESTASLFQMMFPGQIRSIFLEGSYAVHSDVAWSDVDLLIVFKNHSNSTIERAKAKQFAENLAQVSRIEMDVSIADEAEFSSGLPPYLKFSSQLIAGDDIRQQYDLIPIVAWARERMHAAYWLMIKVFDRPPVVSIPCKYPDSQDPFYGYLNRTIRLEDGRQVPSTRNLIRVTSWAATALLAYQARQYVRNKKDCATLYRQYIQDGWEDFLEMLYTRCRTQWEYRIPDREADREVLRSLCHQTLSFENHFLSVYQMFLLQELRSGVPEREGRALWIMDQIPYQDEEVVMMVKEVEKKAAPLHPEHRHDLQQ